MMSASVFLLGIVIAVTTVSVGRSDDLLYPWGEKEGDTPGPQYAGVFPITMTTRIRYFKQYYQNISLCVGGRIGFSSYRHGCGSDNWYYPPSLPTIIPFGINQNLASNASGPWSVYIDYYNRYKLRDSSDIATVETLWYRTTKDPSLLQRARDDVRQNFNRCHMNFVPKELFIVTWTDIHDIDFCEARGWEEPICSCMIYDSPFNSLVYMVDGIIDKEANYVYCNCMLNGLKDDRACICRAVFIIGYYPHNLIQFNSTFCDCLNINNFDVEYCNCEVFGECPETRRDVNPVLRQRREQKVGFDKGKDLKWSHEYSGSEELYKLATDSNVGVPGRWMYKVSGRKIVGPDCKKIPFDP